MIPKKSTHIVQNQTIVIVSLYILYFICTQRTWVLTKHKNLHTKRTIKCIKNPVLIINKIIRFFVYFIFMWDEQTFFVVAKRTKLNRLFFKINTSNVQNYSFILRFATFFFKYLKSKTILIIFPKQSLRFMINMNIHSFHVTINIIFLGSHYIHYYFNFLKWNKKKTFKLLITYLFII